MVSGDLHRSTVILIIAIAQESVLPKDSTGINIMQVANIHAMAQRCMTKPEMISTCNSLPFGVHLIASGSTRPDANRRPLPFIDIIWIIGMSNNMFAGATV